MTAQAPRSSKLDYTQEPYKALTDQALSELAKAGDTAARWALTYRTEETILNTVHGFVKNLPPRGSISVDDLEQDARLAVYRVVNSWDAQKGVPLGAYVHQVIQNEIRERFAAAGAVAADKKTRKKGRELRNTAEAFREKHGRSPELYELSESTGLPCWKLLRLLSLVSETTSFEQVDREAHGRNLRTTGSVIYHKSYEEPTDESTPLTIVGREDLLRFVRAFVGKLSPIQCAFITKFFGLDNQPPRDAATIRAELGITAWRYEKLKGEAFAQLRGLKQEVA